MKLLIKNMVSLRCKMIVQAALEKLRLPILVVDLGEVETVGTMTREQLLALNRLLQPYGLELLEDQRSMLIEKIKTIIIEMIHHTEEPPLLNFSAYLSERPHYDYNYLSNLFSAVKGITIEHYIIANKIERAKELLLYKESTLTQIAGKLHYSSVSHLSSQFKKVTGLTPSQFKAMRVKRLITLENL